MATYTMNTRERVVEFLDAHRREHSQRSLQFLGSEHKQVRFESLKLILQDLKDEGFIEVKEKKILRVADVKAE